MEEDWIIFPHHKYEDEDIDQLFLSLSSPQHPDLVLLYEKLIDYTYKTQSQRGNVDHEIRFLHHICDHYKDTTIFSKSTTISATRLIAAIFNRNSSQAKSFYLPELSAFLYNQLLLLPSCVDDVEVMLPTLYAMSFFYFSIKRLKAVECKKILEIAMYHRNNPDDMLRRIATWSIALFSFDKLIDAGIVLDLASEMLHKKENSIHVLKHYPSILSGIFLYSELPSDMATEIYELCIRWTEHPSIVIRSRTYTYLSLLVQSKSNPLTHDQVYAIYKLACEAFKKMKLIYMENAGANVVCVVKCIGLLKEKSEELPISILVDMIIDEKEDAYDKINYLSWLKTILDLTLWEHKTSSDLVFNSLVGILERETEQNMIEGIVSCLKAVVKDNKDLTFDLTNRMVNLLEGCFVSLETLKSCSPTISTVLLLIKRIKFDADIAYEMDNVAKEALLKWKDHDDIVEVLKIYAVLFSLGYIYRDHFRKLYFSTFTVLQSTNKSLIRAEVLNCFASSSLESFEMYLAESERTALLCELIKPTIDDCDEWLSTLGLLLCEYATLEWIPNHLIDPTLDKFNDRTLDLMLKRTLEYDCM